jgi:hypothetical protein
MMKDSCAIEGAWRLFLGLMIFAAAVAAVVLIYSGFLAAVSKHWPVASAYLMMAGALCAGVMWLCQNRNELVGFVQK